MATVLEDREHCPPPHGTVGWPEGRGGRAAPTPRPPFDVVALACSMGGLSALTAVLAPLPADFPTAIVVVQHLSSRHPSGLADLLGRRTALPVVWAAQGQPVRPGTVHVAPPDYHTTVAPDGTLALSQGPKVQFTRPAANPLFASVARRYDERAIAVVLTGAGCDGAEGVRTVKARGGRVLVQDAATAAARGMPGAAIVTGCADFVLPLDLIATALVALTMAPGGAAFLRVQPPPARPNPAHATPSTCWYW